MHTRPRPLLPACFALLATLAPAISVASTDGSRPPPWRTRNLFPLAVLPSGKVPAVSGRISVTAPNNVAGTELYDPQANSWTSAGTLNPARWLSTATVLQSGKVLVTGGNQGLLVSDVIGLADLYDPATNTWSPAASMSVVRTQHTAALLTDGKVLVAGGKDSTSSGYRSSAELYDPAANSWSPAGNFPGVARSYHSATLLNDGKVLVAGGFYFISPDPQTTANSALYNPATNSGRSRIR